MSNKAALSLADAVCRRRGSAGRPAPFSGPVKSKEVAEEHSGRVASCHLSPYSSRFCAVLAGIVEHSYFRMLSHWVP